MMTQDELWSWMRLTASRGIGPATVIKLLAAFGSAERVLSRSTDELASVITASQASALRDKPPAIDELVQHTLAWMRAEPPGQFRAAVSLADANYPRALLSLADPPALIFVMGSQAVYDDLASKDPANDIAIVGSRNATPQGASNARAFAKSLSEAGLHVVSGLALGIDGAAHEGALQAQRSMGAAAGAPIAVVGTGLDRVYPKQHLDLARDIAHCGLLISEFPAGTPPRPEHFPRRNRIIAALTQGTLVVEAAMESGSLITARQALDLGKEVFAIPGSIHSPQAKGCHHLIKQGAKLVESANDVLEELVVPIRARIRTADGAPQASTAAPTQALPGHDSERDDTLLTALGFEPVHFDTLIDRTGLAPELLQVQLLERELNGEISRLGGGLFQRQVTT